MLTSCDFVVMARQSDSLPGDALVCGLKLALIPAALPADRTCTFDSESSSSHKSVISYFHVCCGCADASNRIGYSAANPVWIVESCSGKIPGILHAQYSNRRAGVAGENLSHAFPRGEGWPALHDSHASGILRSSESRILAALRLHRQVPHRIDSHVSASGRAGYCRRPPL